MTRDIKDHATDYFILGIWLMMGLWALVWWRSNTTTQLTIMFIMLTGYVIWGTIHHYRLEDLNAKIVLEYGLIAALALVVVWSVMTML